MKEKFNPEEKKILVMWTIAGVVIFLLVLGIKFVHFDFNEEKNEDDKYKVVTNYDRYYTVIGAINKYYAFYNSKSYENVLHILNSDFVKQNSITLENIKEFLPENEDNLSYNGKIMCSKDLKTGITSYLVEGYESKMNTGEAIEKKYYNVILDGNEFVFSIEPIDEEFYGGNCNG